MTLLDRPEISGAYFFPRRDELDDPWVVSTPEAILHCHYRVIDPNAPTLIHFHGNGETVGDYVRRGGADGFMDLGVNLLFAEYRGYGGSSGEPALVAQLEDCEAIFASLDLPASRVIVFGRSIGSLYAIELASRHPDLGGLILESGIADPSERFLTYADLTSLGASESEVEAEAQRYFNHAAKLRPFRRPALILHAEDDTLIHVSHAERNYRWASQDNAKVELKKFPSGGHNAIMAVNFEAYFRAIAAFIELTATS